MRALLHVLVCSIATLWAFALPAFGQDAPAIDLVKVSLWPEYDKPEMLVLVEFWLAPDTAMPVTVAIPMPAAAGAPHAVAKRGADGTLFLANHEESREGDWTMARITTDQIENRVEYYAPLSGEAPQRTYQFAWPGAPSRIGRVEYEVLQPLGAADLEVTPPPAREAFDADGRRYVYGTLPGLAPGQAAEITVRYTRATPEVAAHPPMPAPAAGQAASGQAAAPGWVETSGQASMPGQVAAPARAAAPAQAAAPGAATRRSSANSVVTWVLGILVLLLSFAVVYLYFRPRGA